MGCRRTCGCIVPAVISLLIAVIVGVIFTPAVVTGLTTLLFIIFGVAAYFLLALIAIVLFGKRKEDFCICEFGTCLLVGSLGAIITSAITLALTVSATVTAILVGIVTFFIVLAIIQFFLLVFCLVKSSCMYKE